MREIIESISTNKYTRNTVNFLTRLKKQEIFLADIFFYIFYLSLNHTHILTRQRKYTHTHAVDLYPRASLEVLCSKPEETEMKNYRSKGGKAKSVNFGLGDCDDIRLPIAFYNQKNISVSDCPPPLWLGYSSTKKEEKRDRIGKKSLERQLQKKRFPIQLIIDLFNFHSYYTKVASLTSISSLNLSLGALFLVSLQQKENF